MRITGIILVSLVLGAGLLVTMARAGEWKLTASDAAVQDQFGASVSISGDYAVVGAVWNDDAGDCSGSAYIYLLYNSCVRWLYCFSVNHENAKLGRIHAIREVVIPIQRVGI